MNLENKKKLEYTKKHNLYTFSGGWLMFLWMLTEFELSPAATVEF